MKFGQVRTVTQMTVVVVDDMAVGVSSVTMGGVAMEGCIDYVGGMVWVAVDNRAMSNAMSDSKRKMIVIEF